MKTRLGLGVHNIFRHTHICVNILKNMGPPMGTITSHHSDVTSWGHRKVRPAFRETSIFPGLLVRSLDIPILFPPNPIRFSLYSHLSCQKKNIELPATSRFSGDPQTNSAPAAAFPDKDHPGQRGVGGFEAQRIGDFSDWSDKNGQISIDTFCIDTNMAMCFCFSCLIRR